MKTKIKLSVQLVALGVIALLGFVALPLSPHNTSASQPWADNLSCTSATLNGHIEPNGANTEVWFEYSDGNTSSLGQRSPSQFFSQPSDFSYRLNNLSPNKTYFFRAMAKNQNGSDTGNTLSFFTQCDGGSKPIIVNFSANPSSMTWPQNSTTLSWTVTGADSCWATASPSHQFWNSNNPVNTASGGTQPIPNLVKGDNRFTLECRNAAGSVSKTVTVRVNDAPQNVNPKGYLDVASCTEIKGWAFGTNYASVNVRLTDGSNTVTVPANENRQDVGDVYPDAGDWHGFSIATPNIFKDSNSHTIHAYIQGTNTELGTSPKTFGPCVNQPVVNGGWSPWTPVNNQCELTYTQTRTCTNPSPSGGGRSCTDPQNPNFDGGNSSRTITNPQCPVGPSKPTVTITADNQNLPFNNSGTTIRWFPSSNASSCSATGGSNGWAGSKSTVSGSSFPTGSLTNQTTYTITCSNSAGSSQPASVTVGVGNPPNISGNLTISPPSCIISPNQSTCTTGATWTTESATSPRVVDRNTGATLSTSANQFSPMTVWVSFPQTTYDLKNGSTNLDTEVATASCASGTSWNGSICASAPGNPSVSLSANPQTVPSGGSTQLTMSSSNVSSCTANSSPFNSQWTGSKNPNTTFNTTISNLTVNTTFNISCIGNNGQTVTDSKQVTIQTDNNISVDLRADDENIDFDERTTLRWYPSSTATSCTGSNGDSGWSGTKSIISGSTYETRDLRSDTTYTIRCLNSAGNSAEDSVRINVDDEDNDTDPSVDLRADDLTVAYGQDTTLRWTSRNADSCRAAGGSGSGNRWSGNKSRSGSFDTGNLTSDVTYRIICEDDDGDEDEDSLTVRVENQTYQTCQDPSALNYRGTVPCRYETVTYRPQPTVVLYADKSSVPPNGAATVSWITTNATSCVASGGSTGWAGTKSIGPASFYTGSLSSGRTFTLTCTNAYGSATDSVYISVQGTVTRTPVTPTSYVIINSSVDRNQPIVPTIDNTRPHPGDEINYTVTYQNIGNASITNLVLRLTLPYEVDYLTSNPNNPTRVGNNLTFTLGTLRANAQGTVTVRVRVRQDAPPGALLSFPAILTYVDPFGNAQSVSATVEAQIWTPGQPQPVYVDPGMIPIPLGASVFGAGFLPTTMFGWLILFVLILLLLWLARYLYTGDDLYARRITTTTVQH